MFVFNNSRLGMQDPSASIPAVQYTLINMRGTPLPVMSSFVPKITSCNLQRFVFNSVTFEDDEEPHCVTKSL